MKVFRTIRVENRRAGGLALLTACALLFSLLALAPASAGAPAEGGAGAPAFPTPEDAIKHFCGALAANDFAMALEACAVREQAEGFDFPGYVDRLKVHMLYTSPAPSTGDMYKDLNEAALMGGFANQIKTLIYSFFVTEGLDGTPVTPADRAYAEEFERAVDAKKLANLKLLRIDPPMKSILESAKNVENFGKMAKLYGAEEMTERIALYELDGRTFVGGFGLYRYASGWKICRLYSNLAGLSAMGAAAETTTQQYEGML
jgi:hypothetical protein